MTPFESEVWLAQRERRAQARRNSQMKRLVLVILADLLLIVTILYGAMKWAGRL